MGNRAVITTEGAEGGDLGIYLHWNGGPESVLAFLEAAKQLEVRNLVDDNYGFARLTQIIGNFFGGTTSIGIDVLDRLDTDNGDNGVYYVNREWQIVGRAHGNGPRTVDALDERERERYAGILADTLERNRSIFTERH